MTPADRPHSRTGPDRAPPAGTDPGQSPDRPGPAADAARMRAILVATAAVAFALAPFVTPPFAGYEGWPALPAQPAGWAFAIWGPIYAGLVIHAGVGLFARAEDAAWDHTRIPLMVSLEVGAGWLVAATAAPVLSVAMIAVMLAGALAALLRAPPRDPWTAGLPLGLYAGWLTAAAPVAVGTWAAASGLPSGGVSWAVLAVATGLGLAVVARTGSPGYAAALAWALAGVAAARFGEGGTALALGALAALAALGVAFVLRRRAA